MRSSNAGTDWGFLFYMAALLLLPLVAVGAAIFGVVALCGSLWDACGWSKASATKSTTTDRAPGFIARNATAIAFTIVGMLMAVSVLVIVFSLYMMSHPGNPLYGWGLPR